MRDNELAARSIGVDVWRVRFVAFVVSGFGCGLAGGAYYMGATFVSPDSAFDINWVVMMMFATLIGGIGSVAIAASLYAPRGLVGLLPQLRRARPPGAIAR